MPDQPLLPYGAIRGPDGSGLDPDWIVTSLGLYRARARARAKPGTLPGRQYAYIVSRVIASHRKSLRAGSVHSSWSPFSPSREETGLFFIFSEGARLYRLISDWFAVFCLGRILRNETVLP